MRKRGPQLLVERFADSKSADGYRAHLTADAHGQSHQPRRSSYEEQASYAADLLFGTVRRQGERACDLDSGGCRHHTDVSCDRTTCVGNVTSVVGRAGAGGGLLCHDGNSHVQTRGVRHEGSPISRMETAFDMRS